MIPKKPALGLDPRVADFSDKIMLQSEIWSKVAIRFETTLL
jgi:hypothetical protein